MKLILLIGKTSVGKMTVGQELMNMTDLRLFHNHMTIEPVIDVFGYFHSETIKRMREVIFQEFAKTDNYGLIFTCMWAFDQQSDWDYIEQLTGIFENRGAKVYYVELVAPQETRLLRNSTENRLKNKYSKRDIETSDQRLMDDDKKYRCVSYEGEIKFNNYMKIDNSDITAKEAAKLVKDHFRL
ncbi:MAG: AAA family ATPase [Tetragenococcus koreensis]|nr:AAA family ATPase [Tetragenococcus koreensis]MDN6317692.1 AAA family ATPase [Lactococcus lactis]